ncbi:MAG: hypothetical protein WD036_03880 [Bauldia sp.]
MSAFYGPVPVERRPETIAGGQATGPELFAAARDAALYVDNANASFLALDRAYDERIAAVREATGIHLANPLRQQGLAEIETGDAAGDDAARQAAFAARLAAIERQHPQAAPAVRAAVPIEDDALAIARDADERLGRFFGARRDVAGKWLTVFGGGMLGALRDPVQVGLLLAGGGPGGARSVAGRILTTATREAAVSGVGEAAMQPGVQAWRERAGLEHGMRQAALNTVMATALGGVFGLAGQGIAEGARVVLRAGDLDMAAAEAARRLPPDNPLGRAMSGDAATAAELLEPIAPALRPEARGALSAADADRAAVAAARTSDPASFDQRLDAAIGMAEEIGSHSPRPDYMAGLRRKMLHAFSRQAPEKAPEPQSLFQFLAARGGLADEAGELTARDFDKVRVAGLGGGRARLVREDGMSLDEAREAALEAGYLRDEGAVTGGESRSSLNDLLDALDREAAGEPVFSDLDADLAARRADRETYEAMREELDAAIGDVGAALVGDLDEATKRRAVKIRLEEGLDPLDAIERAVLEADEPAAPVAGRAAGRAAADPGEDVPWEDLAAFEDRAGAFEPGVDGAAQADELAAALDDDANEVLALAVGEDGALEARVTGLDEALEQAQRDDDLAALLAGCKVA